MISIAVLSLFLGNCAYFNQAKANPQLANYSVRKPAPITETVDHWKIRSGIASSKKAIPINGASSVSSLPVIAKNAYTCLARLLLIWPYNISTIDTLIPVYYWDTCDL